MEALEKKGLRLFEIIVISFFCGVTMEALEKKGLRHAHFRKSVPCKGVTMEALEKKGLRRRDDQVMWVPRVLQWKPLRRRD